MLKSGIAMWKNDGIFKFCKAVGNNECKVNDHIAALAILVLIFDNLKQLDLGCVHNIPDGFLCQHQKVIRYSMNSNGTELEQVVHTHRTSSSCWSGWPRGLWWTKSQSSLYLLPYQWVAALAHTYSLPLLFGFLFTLHLSVAQNLNDMKRFTFEIGAVQLLSVTEIQRRQHCSMCEKKPCPVQELSCIVWTYSSEVTDSRSQPVLAVIGYLIYDVKHCRIWRI